MAEVDAQTGADEQPVLGPAQLLGPIGSPVPALPSSVVMVFDDGHRVGRALRRHQWPFRSVSQPRPDVTLVVASGPGAPTAAVSVEMLAHLGVQQLVVVGVCGALGRVALTTGDLVVACGAISDDGTSPRYPSPPDPSQELTERIAGVAGAERVTTVSTDVPFRHTAADVARFAAQAEVIEMEAAAVFAAARTMGIDAAALLAVSDHYHGARWQLGDRAVATAAARRGVNAAVAAMANGAGERSQ